MSEKEIAMQILFKMLDRSHITLTQSTSNAETNNQKNLETICNAYKAIYKAVKEADQ